MRGGEKRGAERRDNGTADNKDAAEKGEAKDRETTSGKRWGDGDAREKTRNVGEQLEVPAGEAEERDIRKRNLPYLCS